MRVVDAGERARELSHHVTLAFEHDAPRTVGARNEPLSGLEAHGAELGGRDRDLMFGADCRRPPPSFPYLLHRSKGTGRRSIGGPRLTAAAFPELARLRVTLTSVDGDVAGSARSLPSRSGWFHVSRYVCTAALSTRSG